jgi:hypothetical protein
MWHRLFLAALLLCASLGAQAEPPGQPPVEPASMRFEWVQEGPADVCGTSCREWVAATGPITADTIADFELFSQVRNLKGATIVLDSGGGSVLASLELGRKVRALGMTTSVGRTDRLPAVKGEEPRGRLIARGECASMCVFVLLGGTQRRVPSEARILVHQIWPGGKRYDASAETYTAEELVRIQRDVGRIARYVVEMGGDIELFELAMKIPPWERLRVLSPGELRKMGLQTIEMAEAPTSGAIMLDRPARTVSARSPERGWTLAEGATPRSMQRQHPLTIEGDEIGQFALTVSCPDAGGSYRVAYAETRALQSEDLEVRLTDVNLYLEGERAALAIDASAPRTGTQGELQSRATGLVSAKFVEKLRRDPGTTIVVGTRASDNTRTSIRVGGVGFAKALPRLTSSCKS